MVDSRWASTALAPTHAPLENRLRRRRPIRPTRALAACVVAACALAACALAACASGDPLAPGLDGRLVGTWATSPEPLAPQGSWQRTFTASADGRVAWRGVSYGLYPGQGSDDVSAEVTLYGRLDGLAGAFVVRPDSVVTSDRFYGPSHREVQRDFAPGRDTTRYTLAGDVLVLRYGTRTIEGIVPTTETLRRSTGR